MNTIFTRSLVIPALIAIIAVGPGMALAHTDGNGKSDKSIVRSETFVQLTANGDALVRGAEVTAISGSTVTAETSHGDVDISWTVETDGNTEFITHRGGSFDFDDLDVGDTVSFSGDLTGRSSVNADVLKSWSLPTETTVALSGTVRNIDDDDHTFELTGTRLGTITVEVNGNTSFVGRNGLGFGDLSDGDHVAASGSYAADAELLTATKISLDSKIRAEFGQKVKGWFDKHFNFWKK